MLRAGCASGRTPPALASAPPEFPLTDAPQGGSVGCGTAGGNQPQSFVPPHQVGHSEAESAGYLSMFDSVISVLLLGVAQVESPVFLTV